MLRLFDHPFLILVFTFGASWLTALIDSYIHIRQKDVEGNILDDFKLVLVATLTLLAGYITQGSRSVLFILPIALAISFFLSADSDSPGWGVIRVHP
jgi:hypothetical protein